VTRPLIILGTGGNALDLLDIMEAQNAVASTWHLVGFLDDDAPAGEQRLGAEILGPLAAAPRFRRHWFVNAIGSDASFRRRAQIVAKTGLGSEEFATLVHPAAAISSRATLGPGTYVSAGAVVAGNVTVGRHVALGPACVIGHDTVIADFSMVAPAAVVSGAVRIGESCYIGARAVIRQRLRIGERALVGMGAVVTREVAPHSVVVGNPARPLVKA
jgi:sugar O-acyltransferase (sialic acid O-acetyltransferase NeuD family)